MGSQKRSFRECINTWVQTIAIVIAGLWALWNFVFKEILLPKSAPINISLNLELKKMPTIEAQQQKQLSVVELNAIAKNPSSREVTLFPSSFIVTGYKMLRQKEKNFIKMCDKVFEKDYSVECARNHATIKFASIIITGGLYHDKILKPNEQIERSIVFYIPFKDYDIIQAVVNVPTAREKRDIMLKWTFDKENKGLIHTYYRINAFGGRDQIDNSNPLLKEIDFQFASSAKMLSLWGSK